MSLSRILRLPALVPLLLLLGAASAGAVTLPPNFAAENAVPGTSFIVPTSVAFLPNGDFLVGEKRGMVWMVRNGVKLATPVWANVNQVLDYQDRGLLGVAVDPNYATNHLVYFLYTVDPDSNGVDDNILGFGRLVRFQMNATGDTNTVNPSTRAVLMGVDWRHGPLIASLSHTIGSLRWGSDGSLLVSAGDGGSFMEMDAGGLYPAAFGPGLTDPNEDIGAFRAQDITSLCGKILRINPTNGWGYASNPYAVADLQANRSKVFAYGLRNPFRFTPRPGTGSTNPADGNPGQIMLGDVGWNRWEELNVVTAPGQNFGWPCWEGALENDPYIAGTPAHNGCGSVGSGTNPAPFRLPLAWWHHSYDFLGSPPGFTGNASVGGVFYGDTLYPASYHGRYFFADYGGSWIRSATFDPAGNLLAVADFGSDMDWPVDLRTSPVNGDLYYVSITTGEVRRIHYGGPSGGNTPPVVQLAATPLAGVVPLNVNFSSAGSFDPDGDTLTYAWTFGDGGTSTQPNPSHLYQVAGDYTAILTLDDGHGGQAQASVVISVGVNANFPSTAVLDNFNRANGPIGGSWVDDNSTLVIQGNTMRQTGGSATTVWSGAQFGSDQEAYITLLAVTPGAAETDLMLKVQGLTWAAGHIEVRYEPGASRVVVSTYHPVQGWQQRGVINGVTLVAGDQFGARARPSGVVDVYVNGVARGQVATTNWPFNGSGGYLGLTITGATSTIFENFGGGNWTLVDAPPTVTVTSPTGGENWVGGSAHTITWNATDDVGVTSVDVHYRDADAAGWIPLALGVPNTGSFTWFVHNTPSTNARVRVVARDGAGHVGSDSSHTAFTIARTPGGIAPTTLRDFKLPGTQPLGAGGFQSQALCAGCHAGYAAAVEPGRNARGTMMMQAARDPLFHACLAVAEQDAPSSGDLCLRCHTPMAWLAGKSQPTSGANVDALGREGLSCNFCHRMVDPLYKPGVSPAADAAILAQLQPAHRPTSYGTGQYVIDPEDVRRGPFADAAAPHAFLQSPFHSKSEMCATCHDVSNPVFERVSGAKYAPGTFDAPPDSVSSTHLMPLERTYSEWLNSAFPSGVYAPEFAGNNPGGMVSQCQDCHMRKVTGQGCNDVSAPVRTNLPLHDMTGGNAWMGPVIASLNPTEVDTSEVTAAANRARAMLQRAATLDVQVAAAGDSFRADVRVTNHTGHKLPTGYPEGRRMWIQVTARDGAGDVVYQSGGYDPATGVLDANGARVYEIHLGVSPGLGGALGLSSGPSFHFTLNDTVYKDNRIPPQGFTNAAYAAFGGQPVDPSIPGTRYADGQNWDLASYPLPGTARSVSAVLYYQTTSKEYVEFLRDQNVTNTAGQTLHTAWSNNAKSPPVPMASDSVAFDVLGSQTPATPRYLSLRPARNPFRGSLELVLALPADAEVEMDVLDVAGRVIARPDRVRLSAGEHRLRWDGHDADGRTAGPGVYWAVVRTGGQRLVRRVVRLQ